MEFYDKICKISKENKELISSKKFKKKTKEQKLERREKMIAYYDTYVKNKEIPRPSFA